MLSLGVGLLKCRLCRHFFLFFFCLLRLWVCWIHEGLYGGLIWILTSTIDLDDVLFFFLLAERKEASIPLWRLEVWYLCYGIAVDCSELEETNCDNEAECALITYIHIYLPRV